MTCSSSAVASNSWERYAGDLEQVDNAALATSFLGLHRLSWVSGAFTGLSGASRLLCICLLSLKVSTQGFVMQVMALFVAGFVGIVSYAVVFLQYGPQVLDGRTAVSRWGAACAVVGFLFLVATAAPCFRHGSAYRLLLSALTCPRQQDLRIAACFHFQRSLHSCCTASKQSFNRLLST